MGEHKNNNLVFFENDFFSSSKFNEKFEFKGILIFSTLFVFAITSYIPYVGGIVIILSYSGLQKTLIIKSNISSVPFPRIICPLLNWFNSNNLCFR